MESQTRPVEFTRKVEKVKKEKTSKKRIVVSLFRWNNNRREFAYLPKSKRMINPLLRI